MAPALLHQVHSRISLWHRFDPSLKTDLFSTAIAANDGLFLIDPIPLDPEQLQQLCELSPVAGIIVTNANHLRAAAEFSGRFSVPIFAHEKAFVGEKPARFAEAKRSETIAGDIQVIQIEGAGEGEIALYHSQDGGTLIVGDALIHFEPHGFTILPRKYCLNEKQMRRSLRQLLDNPTERIFFAHGIPILARANARLRQLFGPADSQS
jgi:glyoxylase-like metal-dependent hydrolase (beta-lactamase superfamily II)